MNDLCKWKVSLSKHSQKTRRKQKFSELFFDRVLNTHLENTEKLWPWWIQYAFLVLANAHLMILGDVINAEVSNLDFRIDVRNNVSKREITSLQYIEGCIVHKLHKRFRNHKNYREIQLQKAITLTTACQTTQTTFLIIIFWNFTIFWYRSNSPQVKRNLISSIGNLVYELPHELLNDLGS